LVGGCDAGSVRSTDTRTSFEEDSLSSQPSCILQRPLLAGTVKLPHFLGDVESLSIAESVHHPVVVRDAVTLPVVVGP
jgi:hypothetical protein